MFFREEHDKAGDWRPIPQAKLLCPSVGTRQPISGQDNDTTSHNLNGRGWGRALFPVILLSIAVLGTLLACTSFQGKQESQDLPYCTPDDLQGLLANGSVHWRSPPPPRRQAGLWRAPALPSTHPQLYLDRCSLRRFTAPEARRCLAAKPLIMIGDSVTRYQFLSLITWLDSGRWPPPEHGTPDHPSPVIESEWTHGWPDFFKGTQGKGVGGGGWTRAAYVSSALGGGSVRRHSPITPLVSPWFSFNASRPAGTTLPFDGRQQCHCFREVRRLAADRCS